MNRVFRVVWNHSSGAWQAVAETAGGHARSVSDTRRRRQPQRLALIAAGALAACCGLAAAQAPAPLPTGGQIVSGSGTIQQQGQTLTITQDSARLAADWQSFSIGRGYTVQFVQPSAGAVALNRVTGNEVSTIQGALKANGQVFLVNPNGVLFTPSAQVQVGSLVASTLALSQDDFLAGRLHFEGDSRAAVVNQGLLQAAPGGRVALLAARVENTGEIQAPQGAVLLGAGRKLRLDLGGPVKLEVDEAAVDALVDAGGAIRADGGTVLMSARAAGDLAASVINQRGLVEARTLAAGADGRIVLQGDGGVVALAGTLDASSPGATGGHIVATGTRVLVEETARLDASGATGGGRINVGGGWQGGDASIANASDVIVREGARLNADARERGDGGTVVVWADGHTRYDGRISATGGAQQGNGGRVEVSGKQALGFGGTVDTSAAHGEVGLLLLDPNTLTIVDGSSGQTGTPTNWATQSNTTNYTIPETVLESLTGNVVLTAVTDIIINNLSDNLLNLSATNMYFYANDESGGSSTGGFTMRDANDVIRLNQGAGQQIVFQGGSVSSKNTSINSNAAFTAASVFLANVETQGADVVFNTKRSAAADPMIVQGTITTHGGNIVVAPGTRFGLSNSAVVNVTFKGAVDTGGGSFTSNMTGTVRIDGGLSLGSGSATFGGTGTQLNSLLQSTGNLTIASPLSFGNGAGISTPGTVTFNSAASMQAGGHLTLTASDFVFNSAVTGNGAAITLRPYDPATNVDVGSAGGGGMLIPTAALNQLSGFGSITIGRSDGTGTTTVTADTSVTAATRIELVNAHIDVTGGTLGNTSGDVVLTGNSVNVAKNISAGSGKRVQLQALGTSSPLQVSASGGATISADLLELGSATTAGLVLQQDLQTSAQAVHLRSAGDVTASSGGVSAPAVAVSAGGGVTLTDGSFDFQTLALAAGGDSHVSSSNVYAVGTVDGVAGADVGAHRLTLETSGSGTMSASQAIRAQELRLLGAGAAFDLGGATHWVDRLAGSMGGGLVFGNGAALTLGAVGASSALQAGGDVAITTTSGDLVLDAPLVTTAAGSTAIVLNAGRSAAAGTATGGNVVVGSGSLTMGAGGRATLFTGSVAGSSGLTALVGSGSGRFRYASDEAHTGYDAGAVPLASGLYAIYREQPLLSVTPGSATTVYGDALPAFGTTVGGQVNGDSGGFSGSAVFARAPGAVSGSGRTPVGAHDIAYQSGLSSALGYGFQDNAASTGELLVQALTLAVAGITVDSKVYDATTTASVHGGTLTGAFTGDTVGVSLGAASFASAGAGTGKGVTVATTLTGADAANYQLAATATASGDVSPRPITVTAGSGTKVYGNADPALGWQVTAGSLLGSDTLAGTVTRSAGENVGGYAVDASALANPNYSVTAQNGLLTITPRPLTVTADAATKVYGNADPALGWHVTGGSLVGGDTLTGTLTRSAGENVGHYTVDASALANANYTVSTVDGQLTITPRPITVTADSASKVYGNADPALGWRVTGGSLVGSDTLAGTVSRNAGENVGQYTVDASALANANYSVSTVDGQLTITPRPITVTADSASKVYGNADPALGWRVTGGSLVGSDTLSGTVSRGAGENVGRYTVDASALANANYTVSTVDGQLTITPRPITVTADSASKVYGNADPALGWRVTGGSLVGSDTLAGAVARSAGENVGRYTVDASALANANYTVSTVDGQLTITPRPITVTADSPSKVYGNTDPALGWRVTGGSLVGSDTLSGTVSRSAGENVGRYTVDASALANANYTVSAVDGQLTITPRPITVTADSPSKVYGNADPALGWHVTGGSLVGSDTLAGTVSRSAGENVGQYTVDASALANANYSVSTVDGQLTITPRPITVTADDRTKAYGSADPRLTYRVSTGELVAGDTLQGAPQRAPGEAAGRYTIDVSSLVHGNYTISHVDGTLTIVREPQPDGAVVNAQGQAGSLGATLASVPPVGIASGVPLAAAAPAGGAAGSSLQLVAVPPGVAVSDPSLAGLVAGPRLFVVEGGIRLPAVSGRAAQRIIESTP